MITKGSMNSLLIDVGSTSIKWTCHWGRSGGKSNRMTLPFPPPYRNTQPYFEIDVEAIFQAILIILRQTNNIDRVCFSIQMHGYVLGDEKGQAITPYISWQDERASLQHDGISYMKRFPYRVTPESGSSLKANLPVISLYAMRSLMPEIYQKARVFYTLGSYLVYRLTGVNATHITDAAPSGFYNAQSAQPTDLKIPHISLPEASMDFKPAGKFHDLVVYTPVGDQQASVLGSSLEPDSYLLNLGTAAQLCTLSEQPVYGDYESRPYFDGQTLCTVTRLLGGREIQKMAGNHLLAQHLTNKYLKAMRKLPSRDRLLVVGGAAHHHRALIEQVCKNLMLPYEISLDTDTLDGLIKLLSKENADA